MDGGEAGEEGAAELARVVARSLEVGGRRAERNEVRASGAVGSNSTRWRIWASRPGRAEYVIVDLSASLQIESLSIQHLTRQDGLLA